MMKKSNDRDAARGDVMTGKVVAGNGTVISLGDGNTAATEGPCLIVGIGASTGGQAALEQLFTTMPADCKLAFVVIVHLHPDGPSYIPEILGRYTPMPVLTAEDGMLLQPDTVHVIPPGVYLTVADGRLSFEKAERTREPHHPIDRFFQSLAADAAERGVAVLLSGFGVDGSAGIRAVREAGGVVLVQEPSSAINPAMPKSAIASGAVDFVLPAEEIAAKIAEIARGNCVLPHRSCRITTLDEELGAIFHIVKIKTGHDFSSYKVNTVMRRIERRMAINEVSGIGKYVALIEENPQEAQALCQDILIGVTSFFRDPDAFEVLRQEVIPRLFDGRNPEEPVRIWHACCATGEEVYSMAILIQEYLSGHGLDAKVQLFATDIDEVAIAQARAGIYPDDTVQELERERLDRFFTRVNGRWQVKKHIRDMVVFAHHSLIKDPPFSRLDLLVCRNFLIYLNPDMQKRLIPLFHQVLRTGGFLFLGNAETVGRNSDLFSTIDNKWKIFERLESKRKMDTVFPLFTSVRMPALHRPERHAEAAEPSPGMAAERLLMERYSPPCVVVSDKFEMLYVSTRLSRFLEVPTGEPTRDILRMVREDLRPTLRAAIYKAFAEQKRIEFRGVKVTDEGRESSVNLIVEPLGPTPGSRLAMVVFEQGVSPVTMSGISSGEEAHGGETSKEMLIRQLEEQLRVTHEQLQATSEQLETSNEGFMSATEELMSINEEFQSANEELHSTNEELETSKEELQALNEELITVNAELQGKVEELNQANSDMENLFASSGVATLFLDRKLNIKGFTPAVAGIFNLISADIGRPFQHFGGKIDWPTLAQDAETVLAGQPFAEKEMTTLDVGRCYLKRIFPYRTQDGIIDGIVATFIDITGHNRAQKALRLSEERYHSLFENMMEGFAYCKMLYDDQGSPVDFVYLDVNDAFGRLTGLANVKGKKVTEVIPGIRESSQDLFEIYGRVALTGEPEKFEIEFKPLAAWLSISVYSMEKEYFVAVFNDITAHKRAENLTHARLRMLTAAPDLSLDETLQMALDEIEAQTGSVIGFYHFLEADQETLSLQTWSSNTLGSMCTAEGKGSHYPISQAGVWVDCVHERRPVIHNDYAALLHKKGMPAGHAPVIREMLIPIVRENLIVAIIGVGNKPTEYNANDIEIATQLGDFIWEIVKRKRVEEALRESLQQNEFLANILEIASQPFSIGYPDGHLGLFNNAYEELTGYTGDELRSIDWDDILTPPEWREVEREKLEELLRTGRPVRYEKEYLRKDGSRVPIELLVHLTIDADRKPLYYYAFVTDITERKRAEEEIRRRVEELRASNEELTRFNNVSVGREIRMIELKKEVNELCGQAGQPSRYPLDFEKR
jgi:two-component system CheB/CheR fusion protein